jgi:hypothetical protein
MNPRGARSAGEETRRRQLAVTEIAHKKNREKEKPSQVSEEWRLEIMRKTNIRTFTLQGQGNGARELIRQQGKRKTSD